MNKCENFVIFLFRRVKAMKKIFIPFLFLLLSAVFLSINACAEYEAQLSPALSVMANGVKIDKCGLRSNRISFSQNDFRETLGLKKISEITICSVPPETDGKLTLNGEYVSAGQSIKGNELDSLCFVPYDQTVEEASFCFSCKNMSCKNALKCDLHLLSSVNTSPVIAGLTDSTDKLSTHKNIMVYSSISASDNDGDSPVTEIYTYAKHGIVDIYDKENGKFTYTPAENYTGADSFEVFAKDSYGNCSKPYKITVKVEKTKDNTVFSDMMRNCFHDSAIKANAYGLMSGKILDGKLCFLPNDCVTRAEFVSYLIKASGQTVDKNVTSTAFADDADIPVNLKSYISYASEKGYISGVGTDTGIYFYPNSNITRAEAGALINNVLCISDHTSVSTFLSDGNVPSWAEDVIATLNTKGMMLDRFGKEFTTTTYLTNEQVSEILCEIYEKEK